MDIFTLSAKLMLDSSSFDRGISDAERKGSSLASKLTGGLVKAGSAVSASLLAGVTASAGAIATLAKSSVDAFSNFEQLEGGVVTLFKDGAADVMQHARDAYDTAGVDMNSYMQTATSFAASLIQGLEGNYQKAAEITDMAVIDMADNANKMGTSLESIQNAYQGFSKQNYTMLDNLKLGYGGTKTEMQRLLKDAEKITNKKYNLQNLADVYEAIHVIQGELGITNATAEEAESTIEGSTKKMRAAWQNLKIAFVDPKGNISDAIRKFVDSARVAVKNYIPAFSSAVKGIGATVREIAPIIAEELPALFTDLLPDLVSGGLALVTGIVQGIVDNLPLIGSAAGQMVDEIVRIFKESDSPVLQFLGDSLATVKEVASFVISLFTDFPTAVATLKESDSDVLVLIGESLESIKGLVDEVVNFFSNFDESVQKLKDSDNPVLVIIGNSLEAVKTIIENIGTLFNDFDTFVKTLQQSDNPVLQNLASALSVVKDVVTFIGDLFTNFDQKVAELESSDNPVLQALGASLRGVKDILDGIVSAIKAVLDWITRLDGSSANVTVTRTFKSIGTMGTPSGIAPSYDQDPTEIDKNEDYASWFSSMPSFFAHAKGARMIPYDNYPALLHRGEEILTPSQARHRNDESMDLSALIPALVGAIRDGIQDATVISYLSGHDVTDNVSKNTMRQLKARRFAT